MFIYVKWSNFYLQRTASAVLSCHGLLIAILLLLLQPHLAMAQSDTKSVTATSAAPSAALPSVVSSASSGSPSEESPRLLIHSFSDKFLDSAIHFQIIFMQVSDSTSLSFVCCARA